MPEEENMTPESRTWDEEEIQPPKTFEEKLTSLTERGIDLAKLSDDKNLFQADKDQYVKDVKNFAQEEFLPYLENEGFNESGQVGEDEKSFTPKQFASAIKNLSPETDDALLMARSAAKTMRSVYEKRDVKSQPDDFSDLPESDFLKSSDPTKEAERVPQESWLLDQEAVQNLETDFPRRMDREIIRDINDHANLPQSVDQQYWQNALEILNRWRFRDDINQDQLNALIVNINDRLWADIEQAIDVSAARTQVIPRVIVDRTPVAARTQVIPRVVITQEHPVAATQEIRQVRRYFDYREYQSFLQIEKHTTSTPEKNPPREKEPFREHMTRYQEDIFLKRVELAILANGKRSNVTTKTYGEFLMNLENRDSFTTLETEELVEYPGVFEALGLYTDYYDGLITNEEIAAYGNPRLYVKERIKGHVQREWRAKGEHKLPYDNSPEVLDLMATEAEQIAYNLFFAGNTPESLKDIWISEFRNGERWIVEWIDDKNGTAHVRHPETGRRKSIKKFNKKEKNRFRISKPQNVPGMYIPVMRNYMSPMDNAINTALDGKVPGKAGAWAHTQLKRSIGFLGIKHRQITKRRLQKMRAEGKEITEADRKLHISDFDEIRIIDSQSGKMSALYWTVRKVKGKWQLRVPNMYGPTSGQRPISGPKLIGSVWEETDINGSPLIDYFRRRERIDWSQVGDDMWGGGGYGFQLTLRAKLRDYILGEGSDSEIKWSSPDHGPALWISELNTLLGKLDLENDDNLKRNIFYTVVGRDNNNRTPRLKTQRHPIDQRKGVDMKDFKNEILILFGNEANEVYLSRPFKAWN